MNSIMGFVQVVNGRKQTFVKSSENAVLKSTKKSTKYAITVFDSEESYEYTYTGLVLRKLKLSHFIK